MTHIQLSWTPGVNSNASLASSTSFESEQHVNQLCIHSLWKHEELNLSDLSFILHQELVIFFKKIPKNAKVYILFYFSVFPAHK